MSGTCSIRTANIAALAVLAILSAQAGAASPPDAAEVFEVKVLEAQVHQGQGEPLDVLYRMEVLSVVRSTSRVQPGETVTVRSNGQSKKALERGWTGTAYLNRDPKAANPGDGRQFVIARTGRKLDGAPPRAPVRDVHPGSPEGRPMSCQPLRCLVGPAPRRGSGPSMPGPYWEKGLWGLRRNGKENWLKVSLRMPCGWRRRMYTTGPDCRRAMRARASASACAERTS